ncbi:MULTISPECIES: IS66 family insertion sequence element accessory protein TnpB [unclassified Endozoicomonas]|uniref:IS66 family insertion sequence element accessory protein TnpB n=1 Tax=unclassified Endozoicomonas TaxID=2644528 RepID=UPI002147C125|nr:MULTISPECIES: IS66 family insertion sequence element accessory protein TnpB [unclassified Endozoicomonas]
MRKSIDGLAALVEQQAGQSPFSQTLYVFCHRKRDKIKLLCWERNGFVLWYKRLEKFRFKWPGNEAPEAINGDLLNQLLDGYDIRPKAPHPTLEYTTLL